MHQASGDDRRVQRTRRLLLEALGSLIREKRYDTITVQDVIDRAGVGRTTFYDHFQDKEDLFLASHEDIIGWLSYPFFADDGSWRSEPSPDLLAFLELAHQSADMHYFLTSGNDSGGVLPLFKKLIARNLAARLREYYREEDSTIPFVVLAQHVAGSMMSLLSWWMDNRTPYSPQEMAQMMHQMNLSALRSALGGDASDE